MGEIKALLLQVKEADREARNTISEAIDSIAPFCAAGNMRRYTAAKKEFFKILTPLLQEDGEIAMEIRRLYGY